MLIERGHLVTPSQKGVLQTTVYQTGKPLNLRIEGFSDLSLYLEQLQRSLLTGQGMQLSEPKDLPAGQICMVQLVSRFRPLRIYAYLANDQRSFLTPMS